MSAVTEPIMLDTTGQAIVTALSQITAMQGPAGADGVDGEDGVSPTVTVTTITGGHRITITDASGAHSFDVMDGEGSSEHIYNVKDYGAAGDGETDDYDAIVAAVADAKANSGADGTRATVYFPAGKYYISRGIGLDETAAPISIIGESSASVTITGGSSWSLLELYRTDSGISYGSTVSGLTLQGTSQYTSGLSISNQGQCVIEDVVIYNSHSAATGYGLTVEASSQVFFSHIQVQGFDTGCYINNTAGYGDVYFSDCRFDGNSTNGFEAYRVSGLYLSNVTMYGNGVTGLVLGHQISGVVSYPFAENVFLNNVVADTSGLMNGALVWADNVMMSNCWFATNDELASSANHGLYIENSSNITITASTFRNNIDNGIYATNSNYISINGCIFRKNGQRDTSTYAVELVACTKITVCGNVFMPDSYQKRGVCLGGCDFFIVANNSLDNTDVPVYSDESTSTTRIIKDNIS